MAGRGGAAPARKGGRFEVKVVADQVRLGRLAYRLRQGQGAIVDVVSLEACRDGLRTVNGSSPDHIRLIQCRSDGPRLSAKEHQQLQAEADGVDGIPVLAWPEDGAVRYEVLHGD